MNIDILSFLDAYSFNQFHIQQTLYVGVWQKDIHSSNAQS